MHTGTAVAIVVSVAAVGVIVYTYVSDNNKREQENRQIENNQAASRENSPRNIPENPAIGLGIVDVPYGPRIVSSIYFNRYENIEQRYMIPLQANF